LRLLAGPHRFEAGWWLAAGEEGDDAACHGNPGNPATASTGLALRDYFVAHNDVAGLVWVFRERLAPHAGGPAAAAPQRWFLHGIFG
jgi:protein ImuB